MNDWRSTFDGANDHEADWEQCFVVLEDLGRRRHAAGLVLRRRPRREGRRPPAALGRPAARDAATATRSSTRAPARTRPTSSAASTSCGCRSPASGTSAGRSSSLRRVWRDTLGQPDPGDLAGTRPAGAERPVRRLRPRRRLAASVRAATSSGRRSSISDEDPWVDGYRGLWGLDTGDRFAGERAPAGPKYTRTGTVRQSWADPLGFAGLAKVAAAVAARRTCSPPGSTELEHERDDRRERGRIRRRRAARSRPRRWAALRGAAGLEHYADARQVALGADEAKLATLRARDVELTRVIAAGRVRLDAIRGRRDGRSAGAPPPRRRARSRRRSTRRRAFGEAWAR